MNHLPLAMEPPETNRPILRRHIGRRKGEEKTIDEPPVIAARETPDPCLDPPQRGRLATDPSRRKRHIF